MYADKIWNTAEVKQKTTDVLAETADKQKNTEEIIRQLTKLTHKKNKTYFTIFHEF